MTPTKPSTKIRFSPKEELELLRKILEITTSELELSQTLKGVVKTVTSITQADSVFIYLLNARTKTLTLMASKTPHKKELGELTLKAGEGITGWVARESKCVAIPQNAYKDKRFKNFDVLPEDQYEGFLSVPIVNKKKVIGVINVQHIKPREYARETTDTMMIIGRQIGGILENARLYEETKQKAFQFDSLNRVSRSITSVGYLDEILNLITVVTAEMLNTKICSIMLVDPKGRELVLKATHSLSSEYMNKPNVEIEGSMIGEAIKTKSPVYVADVRNEDRYMLRELAVREELSSMLTIPMIIKDTAIGVINVYTKQPHEFTPEEKSVLQIIANQAAVAVENTKLVEEAVKAKEALETRKTVERAKGILMKMKDLDEDAAHRIIHKKAMDSCRSMKEIAESIILLSEL